MAIEIGVEPSTKGRRITPSFNLSLFAFNAALGVFQFVVGAEWARGVGLEELLLSCGLDASRYVAVLLISAAFLRAFWARLVAPLAGVRPIDYQESIAILLMLGLLIR